MKFKTFLSHRTSTIQLCTKYVEEITAHTPQPSRLVVQFLCNMNYITRTFFPPFLGYKDEVLIFYPFMTWKGMQKAAGLRVRMLH